MPRSKANKLRGLEPEGPDDGARPRPRRAPPAQPNLDRVIGVAIGAIAAAFVDRMTQPAPPAAPDVVYGESAIYRDVRTTPVQDIVLARCTLAGTPHARCGQRYVPRQWLNCPYCGQMLQAAIQ